jgi:hypothetical protein
MAAFFTSDSVAPCLRRAPVARAAQYPLRVFAALFARFWDGALELVVFLWVVMACAFFGLVAAGSWFA